jgi:DNA polymerase-3 subunit delta'
VINNLSFFKKNKEQSDLILELMMTWFRDLLVLKETNNETLIINQDKKDLLKKHTFKADHLNFVEIINKIKDTKININEYNVNYDISIENLIFSIIN